METGHEDKFSPSVQCVLQMKTITNGERESILNAVNALQSLLESIPLSGSPVVAVEVAKDAPELYKIDRTITMANKILHALVEEDGLEKWEAKMALEIAIAALPSVAILDMRLK